MDWSLSSYDNLKIKISTENSQQYVALQEGLLGDRLTGSNFWSSESRVKARFHYAESREK